MELHCVEGTQRFDEPVSRMTLNVCGGVPRVMSAKSASSLSASRRTYKEERLTLGVCEIGDGNRMVALGVNPWRLEHGLRMRLRADTKILLAEMLCLRSDRQRLLLID